jgi:hypothetical protein
MATSVEEMGRLETDVLDSSPFRDLEFLWLTKIQD